MTSKTPQFDKALDDILDPLVPHERTCKKCGKVFKIEAGDINFFRMLRVPPPALCPLCRRIRRFGLLMRVPKFFKKKCSAPGHEEEIVTVFPPSSPHKVYDFSFYQSDEWDGGSYGRDINASRPFFEQFKELFFDTPHISLEHDPMGVGVEYTLGGRGGKNNYYSSAAYGSEECMYVNDARFSKNIVDSSAIFNSEFCYEAVTTAYSNKGIYLINCSHCIDCAFLFDCKNCTSCFLSSNLRNASYVFQNQQLTKEEYQKRMKDIDLGERDVFEKMIREFDTVSENALRRSIQSVNCVDTIGDSNMECKDCYFVFRSQSSEHCRYSENTLKAKDIYGVTNTVGERTYESVTCLPSNIWFSIYARDSTFVEYCAEVRNCNYCFGCVSIRGKQFYIMNKPYTEEEYWNKVDELKTAMLARGEYGEFFDLSMGLMPYQSSSGGYYFPMTEEEMKQRGIPFYPEPESRFPEGVRILDARKEVPGNIKDVTDEVLKHAIRCETSGKAFRITPSELQFYRRMGIPIPTKHPWQRMIERRDREFPFALYEFSCPRCKETSLSVYTQEEQKKYRILCEKCYLKEVI